ncbi:hypothetical protein [Streptomyces subrutilus]|nr:hypothetical protein [Streptomyces subrutilus]
MLSTVCLGTAIASPAVADANNGQYTVKGPAKKEGGGDSVARCNKGDLVVGGGFHVRGPSASTFVGSGPTSDATGWWANIVFAGSVEVYVLCQKAAN